MEDRTEFQGEVEKMHDKIRVAEIKTEIAEGILQVLKAVFELLDMVDE